ncbi:MAG: hypothetical protein QOH57_616 [Mycobacterium sp.]|jgi:hypothetical protein|nr:hypothetical protein [Mycobacterium sp.]
MRAGPIFNAPIVALATSPRWGKYLGGTFAMVTYTGRRSGRTVSLPVGYRRRGDDVVIGVSMPDAKTWWKNFLGDGAPLTITLDGNDRTGHAVARRDEKGRVAVDVRLTP